MKKIHLLLFVGLLSATIANAGRVTEQEALQKAQQFMKGKVMRPVMSRSLTRVQSVKEDCAFYIFNAEDQGGYVIISADDRTDAVLGYSDTGAIDIDNMPENLRWWLQGYAEQIKAMSNDMPLTKTRTTRGTMSAISPLIQTKWDQYEPYNLQCPEYEMEKCVTGCTSTALAQVMYYHKWPTSCPAIPAYVTKSLKISLPELPATSFKWDLMKTSYDYSAVGDAENAVAELLRYCGQANEIDYTTTGSAASLKINVMINTFGYSKNMRSLYRGNYTDSHWESLIYEELSNQRPVLYCGNADPDSSIKEGHQFICDGYDGNGKFHINWGWGGRCDGYYLLSACNPEDEGKPNGFKFNIDQLAITGFKPAKEGEVEIPSMRGDTWDYIIQAYTRSSVEEDFEDVSITGRITANYNINPTSSFTTEVGWGLYQGEDMIKTFSSGPQTFEAKNQSSVKNETLISFGKGLTDGTYQLRQLYKDPETDSWCLCLGYLVESLIVEINGTSMIIKRFDMGSVKFTVNNMSCSEVPSVDVPVTVTADITNQGNSSNFVVCLWYQKEGETTWHNSASRVLYIDKDNTFPAEMQFTPKDAGNYNLKLTSNYSEEALATLQIVVSATENVVVDGVTYFCSPAYNSAKIVVAEKDALPRELVIPSTVTTSEGIECRVQSIDEYVFLRMNTITRLTISEGVKTIGRYAFTNCYNLKRIELPASLTSIGEQAFSYCERVVAVISKVNTPFNIEESVFASGVNYNPEKGEYDCSPSTATLYVPIGSLSAYQEIKGWTKFAKMEQGEPFETIQDGLKYLCSSYSRTATVIDGDYKELENVEIPAEISVDEVPYKVTTVGNSAFCNKRNIRSLTLPEGLETIGDYAFYKIGISELTLPSTLRSIGAWSFGSAYITSLAIPEGVESIGNNAFNANYSLEEVELPSTLTRIGSEAFTSCDRLSIVISRVRTPFSIDEGIFASSWEYNSEKHKYDYDPSCATLYVPVGSLSAYQEIKGWTMFAKIEEGEPFETVQDVLKYRCSPGSKTASVIKGDYNELENVIIPPEITVDQVIFKITAIDENAFYNQRNIQSMALPEGLESIGNWAFYGLCISELTLPSTLRSIGAWSFNSSNITTLAIPEGVESIGKFAFRDCYYLESLELPSSLTDIGEYVISGCDALSSVVSNNRNPKGTNENAFMNLRYDREEQIWFDELPQATLYVPLGCKPKYLETEGWAKFADIQELDGETVSITIGNNGKTTYCGDKALDFSYSDEVKAFIATGFDKSEGTIWMTRVKDVPAGVPVMIKGTANETYHVPVTEGGSSYYKNMFVGNTSGESMSIGETSEDGQYVNYYMSGGQFKSVKTSANIGANKCYLQLPATFAAEATGEGYQVKIAASGKSSFAAPYDLDFTSLNDDVKAFTATGYDASTKTIWLTRVRKVQKGEGLLLKGTGGETYTIPSSDVQAAYENMIVGNIGDEIAINGTSKNGTLTNYYLKGGTYVSVSGSANIGTNKSYLQLPTSMLAGAAGARSEDTSDVLDNLGIPSTCHLAELETESMPVVFGSIGGDDETTGIKDNNRETITNNRDGQWFTLGGQRIDKPTRKGLYIHNGSKVVIK